MCKNYFSRSNKEKEKKESADKSCYAAWAFDEEMVRASIQDLRFVDLCQLL